MAAVLSSHLPVKSVDTTLDFVVDEFRVEDIFSERSVVVTVGDEDVIVKLFLSARAANEQVDQEEEEHQEDDDDKIPIIIATTHQFCRLR